MDFINPEQLKEPVKIENQLMSLFCYIVISAMENCRLFRCRLFGHSNHHTQHPIIYLPLKVEKEAQVRVKTAEKLSRGGIWVADTSINACTDESRSIQLQVKSIGN
jgi:hypothetical protein